MRPWEIVKFNDEIPDLSGSTPCCFFALQTMYSTNLNVHSPQFMKHFLKLLAANCFNDDFSIFYLFYYVLISFQDLYNWHVILVL